MTRRTASIVLLLLTAEALAHLERRPDLAEAREELERAISRSGR